MLPRHPWRQTCPVEGEQVSGHRRSLGSHRHQIQAPLRVWGGGPVILVLGLHPKFLIHGSKAGPDNLCFPKFPGDTDAASVGTTHREPLLTA